MLSKKAKYGLKAMFHLARRFDEGPQLIVTIAAEENIPRKFLEQILLELKKHGMLNSKMGKGGGYHLNRTPNKIYMGEIIRVLDGPIAPYPCVSQTAYARCKECKNEKTCEIRKVLYQVREATSTILDKTSLQKAMTLQVKL